MNGKANKVVGVWRWLWRYASQKYGYLIGILVSIIFVSGNSLLRARALDRLITTALHQQADQLLNIVLFFVGILIIGLVANASLAFFKTRFGASLAGDLRRDFFQSLLQTPMSVLDQSKSGNIISLFNRELKTITDLLSGQFVDVLLQPLLFIAASMYMLYLNWKLYLICYAFLPVISYVIKVLLKKRATYASKYFERTGYTNQLSKECIDGVVEIKSFNLEEQMLNKCKKAFSDLLFYILKAEKIDAISIPIWLLNNQLPKMMCILFGGFFAVRGELTIGQLVAYTQLTLYVSRPASSILGFIGALQEGGAALQRLLPTMDLLDTEQPQLQSIPANAQEGISFTDVSFAYGDNQVLSNCSFSINKKGFNVLAGASGQGKSTSLDLICGLYSINNGTIKINQSFINDGIAYVPQDSVLFPGTIAENIAFGLPNASMDAIQEAAKAAEAHQFISALPNGYDTQVGERGQTLSGGQRQRIAIARAFFRKSPLVLLDEPTASLDTGTEEELIKVLMRLSKECALLVTSHRLSTISQADHICVMEGGRVVQTGTPDKLWDQKDGPYFRLYKDQTDAKDGVVA